MCYILLFIFLKANGNLMRSNVFKSPKQSVHTFELAWYNVKLSSAQPEIVVFCLFLKMCCW